MNIKKHWAKLVLVAWTGFLVFLIIFVTRPGSLERDSGNGRQTVETLSPATVPATTPRPAAKPEPAPPPPRQPQPSPKPVKREPRSFVSGPCLQNPAQREITILWTFNIKAEATVRYGKGKRLRKTIKVPAGERVTFSKMHRSSTPGQPGEEEYIYSTRLKDLRPGTDYSYAIELAGKKETGTFRTFPARAEKFTFIAYGDSRSNPTSHLSVAKHFKKHDPAFILHTGDMVSSGAYYQWEREFFAPLSDIIRHIPICPARGNHEGSAQSMRQLFRLPGNRFWYSFEYANAHFVALDSCDAGNLSQMLKWLEKDLASSKARWKIVFYHCPTYDLGSHRSRWGRDNVVPIMRRNKADISLSGHSHVYVRLHPVYTPGENDKNPTTYFVTGGGGAGAYSVFKSKYLASGASILHYIAFTIEGDTLSGQAIDANGKVFDSFTISKPRGRYTKGYLDKALSEKGFDAAATTQRITFTRSLGQRRYRHDPRRHLHGAELPRGLPWVSSLQCK